MNARPAPILSAKELCVDFGARRALNAVSFDIARGEVLGLLGPNGAGKTTLIKSICGQILPSSGTIELIGKTVRRGADMRQSIGLVPQDIGLYGHLTARENLGIFARFMGLSRTRRSTAIDAALERVGLSGRGADLISTLSGGMKRRINFAAAILHDPALLILDEPTAGVDASSQDAIYALIRSLTDNGMAVLLVTHDLEHVAQICERILMLSHGKIYGLATPKELIKQHFGAHSQSFHLTLAMPPNVHSAALLAEGFTAKGQAPELALHWQKRSQSPSPKDSVPWLSAKLEAQLDIEEISLKRPSLSDLIHTLETKPIRPDSQERRT